jgi:hypothetical protein
MFGVHVYPSIRYVLGGGQGEATGKLGAHGQEKVCSASRGFCSHQRLKCRLTCVSNGLTEFTQLSQELNTLEDKNRQLRSEATRATMCINPVTQPSTAVIALLVNIGAWPGQAKLVCVCCP